MIRLWDESLIDIATVIREGLVPPARQGKRLHCSTFVRWITGGVRGPNGEKVRLEALRFGGRWLTSREAIQRFAEALTPGVDQTERNQSERVSSSAAEEAGRRLTELGI